ncbi:glycosyltransferase family 4 protein [Anaerophilus nitritogenes]|uniref:glycosyltransferase family 4 protein n=1 Tax=Anaerophilus nitritogenes TaxID=2498136 RepID=UPI00101CF666|nr:glycosyltransferase family 1 protein [Anaerophilus nitritogenes]
MKISIDIRPIQTKGNGISVYTQKICNLLKFKKEYQFLNGFYNINNSMKEKILSKLWEEIILPFKLIKNRSCIFHCTKNMGLPIMKVCKYIVTIHDLIPMIFEDEYLKTSLTKYLYYRRIKRSVYNSDIIITDSEYSKRDIIKYFDVNENKIRVVYLGVDNKFYHEDNIDLIEKVKLKYNIYGKYILGIGSNEPRKNFDTLLKAYKHLKEKYEIQEKLVVIGKAWKNSNSQLDNDVIFTGYIDESDLPIIYSGATLFVYPSLYEGFGLPPLEAMACGVPVVTSYATSIPEIVGDAAILVDPTDEKSISEAICQGLNNEFYRHELILQGYEQVEKYTWERTIRELEKVYKEAMI